MIRQMCPNCVQLVELPESAAGTTVPCPNCAKPFPVPAAYTPAVAANPGPGSAPREGLDPTPFPPAPPGLVPHPPSAAPPGGALAPAPDATGYATSYTYSLTPTILKWVPAACLTAIFVLSFFPWVGAYPGGVRLHSQTPWGAAFGYFTPNILAEDETALKELVPSNWLMILYVVLLVVAVFVAWAERAIRDPAAVRLPSGFEWLPGVWGPRYLLIAALCGGLLLLLAVQEMRGFSLETALHTRAVQTAESQRPVEDQGKPAQTFAEEQRMAIRTGQEYGKYNVSGTTALHLALVLHLAALAAAMALAWLAARGPKPPPQVQVRW